MHPPHIVTLILVHLVKVNISRRQRLLCSFWSRPKPTQAGAEGQPLQGHSSQRQLSTKVSGPPFAAASTPGRRAESAASACEIHPLKIQKSLFLCHKRRPYGPDPSRLRGAATSIGDTMAGSRRDRAVAEISRNHPSLLSSNSD